jgi:hypothetical protein
VSGVIWDGLLGKDVVSGAAIKGYDDAFELMGKDCHNTVDLLDKEVNSCVGKVGTDSVLVLGLSVAESVSVLVSIDKEV